MNSALTADTLNRAALLALPLKEPDARIRITVHRNHSFELAGSVLNVFLQESGMHAALLLGGYDDSLTFADSSEKADLHVIWLDAARYPKTFFPGWLSERVEALRQNSTAPILVVCCGMAERQPPAIAGKALFLSLDDALGLLPEALYSERLSAFTGTRLSNEGTLLAARMLGLRYIPALLRPALKALVLDMDNTLYEGVLGEDGPNGVRPFIPLQTYLKRLAEQGFLLAIASRNEQTDAEELFRQRQDFPLRWQDVTAREIGWGDKSESIFRIARKLNIGTDAILFVDDNPGELLRAGYGVPGLKTLAASDEGATLRGLTWFPGLFKTHINAEDALRGKDIEANARRKTLKRAAGAREYLQQLQLRLTFFVNPREQLPRITELLNKTNQFILSFMRPAEQEAARYLTGKERCIVTAAMQDCLSDSGVIAIVLMERIAENVLLRELVISCRALGRGVENDMAAAMLSLGREALDATGGIDVDYARGPRNDPGLAWLHGICKVDHMDDSGRVSIGALPEANLDSITVTVIKDISNLKN